MASNPVSVPSGYPQPSSDDRDEPEPKGESGAAAAVASVGISSGKPKEKRGRIAADAFWSAVWPVLEASGWTKVREAGRAVARRRMSVIVGSELT
jgi:hypothetical protein